MKRITALISLALICALLFASCANDKPDSSVPESTTVYEETTMMQEETEAEEVTEAVSEAETEVSTDAVQDVLQTEVAQTTAASVPTSVEEIVVYFNTAANRIKPEASKVVKNYEKRTVNEDKLVIPSALESAGRSMLASTMTDDTDPIVYETREDITNEFIVPDQSYVSRLKPEWVKSATMTDNGKEYIIRIKLKDQKNPSAGNGVGSVCDVIEANEIAEKASFIEKFTTDYYNCEVVATVDKASGKVVHMNYLTSVVLEVTVNMFGTHDAALGFTFEKDYSITY